MISVERFLIRTLPGVLQHFSGLPGVRTLVSQVVISRLASTTTPRPRALSMLADWSSWQSLTDRSYSGRHLPPASEEQLAGLPSEQDVVALFRRQGPARPSTDSSVLFMFFAQWFTDSFLRTDRTDFRRNTSNHEIDLCQIYGLNEAATRKLREGKGGRLKSQQIDGQAYPPFLFQPRADAAAPLVVKPEFRDLHDEDFLIDVILDGAPEGHKDRFFAVGLEHGNSTIGSTMLNVLFLREHNRIADLLAAEHAGDAAWPDDRLFDTTRNILTVLLLKLVVEEYIVHVSPVDFPLRMVPFIADGARWNRSNWCAIEFNLLYRWHSLVPDHITVDDVELDGTGFRNNNALVLEKGVESLLTAATRTRAGRIGLGNTPDFLFQSGRPGWPSVEERTVTLARKARLRPYNDYREQFGLPRLRDFDELTSDSALQGRLRQLYGDIDALEWYVGIFAEDHPDHALVGELMTRMVAYDAFTQALTNPLLARNVYNESTFTGVGLDIIDRTNSLQDIVDRNVAVPERAHADFHWTAGVGDVTVPAQRIGRSSPARKRDLHAP